MKSSSFGQQLGTTIRWLRSSSSISLKLAIDHDASSSVQPLIVANDRPKPVGELRLDANLGQLYAANLALRSPSAGIRPNCVNSFAYPHVRPVIANKRAESTAFGRVRLGGRYSMVAAPGDAIVRRGEE